MNINFCKEHFIYEISNSITSELIDDILTQYKSNDSYDLSNNSFIISRFSMPKIYNYLQNELQRHLVRYVNHINKLCIIKKDGFIDSNYKILHNITTESFSIFTLNHNIYDSDNVRRLISAKRMVFDLVTNSLVTNVKVLHFIWFLNDFDGTITFWNHFSITPSAGKLLIFPSSWCFPFEELVKMNSVVFTISGYIYRNHGYIDKNY